MSVWYLAADDELLIDLDDYMRPAKRGGPWGEVFFRRRLRDAITDEKLSVRSVFLARSNTDTHFHAVIRLSEPRPLIERLVWQLHLGSDLYRGRADLMRAARGFPAASLLILPSPLRGFWRPPDRECPCQVKHDTQNQFALGEGACAVWRELRGMSPWELFGAPSDSTETAALSLGVVPMGRVMKGARSC